MRNILMTYRFKPVIGLLSIALAGKLLRVGLVCALGLLVGCASRGGPGEYAGYGQNGLAKPVPQDPGLAGAEKKLSKLRSEGFEAFGDNYLKNGNLESAFIQYDKVLRDHPDNTSVRCKRGLVLLAKGMDAEAASDFEKVVKEDPTNALAYEGLGHALFKMDRYEEAKGAFNEALKLNDQLWVSHNFLGIIYDYEDNSAQAVREYQAAIALKPRNGLLYNNLGVSYSLSGEHEKALDAFHQALRYGAKSEKVNNNIGLVLCKLGRYVDALNAFQRSGDEARAYNNIGCFHLYRGDYQKAIACFEKAVKLRPTYYAQASENLKAAEMALYSKSSDVSSALSEDQKHAGFQP